MQNSIATGNTRPTSNSSNPAEDQPSNSPLSTQDIDSYNPSSSSFSSTLDSFRAHEKEITSTRGRGGHLVDWGTPEIRTHQEPNPTPSGTRDPRDRSQYDY